MFIQSHIYPMNHLQISETAFHSSKTIQQGPCMPSSRQNFQHKEVAGTEQQEKEAEAQEYLSNGLSTPGTAHSS